MAKQKINSSQIQTAESWINVGALSNSWVTHSVSYPEASYYKDNAGIVHLRGLIKNGTTTGGTIIFTLPTGYRPSDDYHQAVASNNAAATLKIEANGSVKIAGGVSSTWLDLSGIHFRAA